jgi:hypothetical protein
MMALTTKAHHLLNSARQEAEYEIEDFETTTASWHMCEGLEGGFISFDQHALMLSTIVRMINIFYLLNCELLNNGRRSVLSVIATW